MSGPYRENQKPIPESAFCASCRKSMTAGKSKLIKVTVLGRFLYLIRGMEEASLYFDESSAEKYKYPVWHYVFDPNFFRAEHFYTWQPTWNDSEVVGNLFRTATNQWVVEVGSDHYLISPENALVWFERCNQPPPKDLVEKEKPIHIL